MALKIYSSVAKALKIKVTESCGLIPTFLEVTRKKLVGGSFGPPPPYHHHHHHSPHPE